MNSRLNHVPRLLLVEYVFSKNTTKQKTKRKRSAWVEPWLKNRLYTISSILENQCCFVSSTFCLEKMDTEAAGEEKLNYGRKLEDFNLVLYFYLSNIICSLDVLFFFFNSRTT